MTTRKIKSKTSQLTEISAVRTGAPLSMSGLLDLGMIWVLLALVAAASFFYDGFLSINNLRNVLSQNAPVAIAALGMTFVIIARGFDLSVGAIFGIGAVVYAGLARYGLPLPLAACATIAIGMAAGASNGMIVTLLRVNPFVATLGTASVFGGVAVLISGSAPVIVSERAFQSLGSDSFAGVPYSVLLLLLAFIVGTLVLQYTVYGRALFAVGGNDEASHLAGLPVKFLRISTYVISGVCGAVGGIIVSSRLGVGQADMGSTVALDAIAIVVIGGTSLFGGEGALWRTAVGAMILAVLNNLFDSMAISSSWQEIVKGGIIIFAVAIDVFARTRRT
ncbi:ABC transporter permease [Labrenzia sp. DG1229]|uniref:ABC transporter permease n=1 Tax=Labrenzia sp. DG1229 TaxID=681847 RepID=UPI00049060C5|nr:ABC transporter permease [Labrenzia sp. DG1229]